MNRSSTAWLGTCLVLATLGPPASGAPAVHVEHRTIITLTVRPMTAELRERASDRPPRLELEPGEAGELDLVVAWPEPSSRSALQLLARAGSALVDGGHAVDLRAELTLPDGVKVAAARPIRFEERATALFEVYRLAGRSLTLVVEAAARVEERLTTRPTVGAPVRFKLEVVRVIEGRVIPLEDNYLNTFLGEPVSYAFRIGEGAEAEGVTVRLQPRRMVGELAEIEVQIDGELPTPDDLEVVARSERWLASRGATSTLAFETGDPPTGYRFLVTARF